MPTWVLIVAPVTPPGVIEAGSTSAPDSPIDIGVPYFHQDGEFLALAGRVLPDWYLDPLRSTTASGYELLQAYGALFEKASYAVGELETLAILSFSSGGRNALVSVQFYRPTTVSGAFTIKAGTVVATSRTDRQYQTIADVAFGAGDFVRAAIVSSLGQDSDYNVPGPVVLGDATVLPGEIDTVILPYTDPPFADPALAVRQLADGYGGTAPVLDQIGHDRGVDRSAGEADATYKKRIRALPDTVTPAALRRHLDAIFYPPGLHYDLIETWENRFNSCWNAPIGGPVDPIFGALVALAYNDSRTNRFIPRWMSERDHRGAVVVVVPSFPTLGDRGMAYDDPILVPTPTRGASAWNSPAIDGPSLSGVWDGGDDVGTDSRAHFLRSTYALLRAIKGGGVDVAFVPAEATEALPGAPYP